VSDQIVAQIKKRTMINQENQKKLRCLQILSLEKIEKIGKINEIKELIPAIYESCKMKYN